MTDTRTLRVALDGCGRISRQHFEVIDAIDGLSLVGVCDAQETRAQEAGDCWSVPSFTRYEEMLDKADCDVVTVATPSGLHPEHGIAAESGRHVICEKPMAITLASADALVRACDRPACSCSW